MLVAVAVVRVEPLGRPQHSRRRGGVVTLVPGGAVKLTVGVTPVCVALVEAE